MSGSNGSTRRSAASRAIHQLAERLRSRRRIPLVSQVTAADCGAACLAMVLGLHGRATRLEEVRAAIGGGRDGASAQDLVSAAREFGLRGRGVSIDATDADYLERGSILHWGFRHFVVLAEIGREHVEVVDPAVGPRRVSRAEFEREFTGIALLFEPADDFRTVADERGRSWRYLRRVLSEAGVVRRVLVMTGLVQLFGLGLPLLTGLVVDQVIPRSDLSLLQVVVVGLAGLIVFYFLATYLRALLLVQLRTTVDAKLTMGFLEHLVSLPYGFFQERPSGDLMMRMNSHTMVREILTATTLSAVLDGLLVVGYLVLLFAISPPFGLLVLGLGALRVAVFFATRERIHTLMSESLRRQADAQSYQVQLLAAIQTLKAMGAERRAVDRWSNLYVDLLNVSIARGKLNALVQSVLATLAMASPLIVLAAGTVMVIDGGLSIGTMLAMTALATGFLAPLSALVSNATRFQELGSYLDRIDDVLESEPEQRERGQRPGPLVGDVTLEAVSFRYAPNAPLAVDSVDLEVRAGEMVAIVGRSAAGKSTLAGLLAGLYRPVSGRVRFDGRDLASLDLHAVRRQLGIVTQETHLFGASIRENIALGDPSLSIDDIEAAARSACIHDEIMEMPMGYDTMLVDDGSSLSGGQRQRIALARALARKPAILLLDEATSALDGALESDVQRALESLSCTRIVIAHRLSTVAGADQIVMFERGRIVERGTHEELVRKGGRYQALLATQMRPSPRHFDST